MKIVCGSCGAKYSIADEKVQGKVFKIRCKKCSEVIVVKGTSDSEADEAAADYSAAYGQSQSAAEWYVVIDGDQKGPMTPDEVSAYCTAGQLSAESYCWREGLDDWVMLSTVSEFAHFIHTTAGPHEETMIASQPSAPAGYGEPAQEEAPYQDPEDSTAVMTVGQFAQGAAAQEPAAGYDSGGGYDQSGYGGEAGYGDDGGYGGGGYESGGYDQGGYDQGGYDQGGGYGDSAPAATSSDDGGYGGAYDAGYDAGYDSGAAGYGDDGGYGGGYDEGGGGMFAAFDSGAGSESDAGGLYGGLGADESSDQDSGAGIGAAAVANDLVGARNENSVLFSLSSLDQIASVPKSSGPSAPAGAAQGNDKSGLIDIQKLASAHSAMKGGGDDDNVDAFAASSMSVPALMPMGSHRNNKTLIIGVIAGAAILVVGALIAVVLVVTRDKPPEIIERTVIQTEPAAPTAPSAADEALAAEAKKAAEAALAAAEKEEEEQAEEEAPEEQGSASTKTAQRSTGSTSKTRQETTKTAKTESAPAPTTRTKTSGGGGGGIDDIIGQIDGRSSGTKSGGGTAAPAPKAASNLPPSLTREMVQSTVRRYNAQIAQCSSSSNSGNLTGTATVRFTVEPNGSVSAANVQAGEFRGTDVGGCIERVVRGMNFPATSGESRTINYPFILR